MHSSPSNNHYSSAAEEGSPGERPQRDHSLSQLAREVDHIEKHKKEMETMMEKSLRAKIHTCCTDASSSRLAFIWEWSLAGLIVLSVIFYAFETYATKPAQRPGYPSYESFAAGEIFFTFTFLAELIIRGVACPYYFTLPEDDPDAETPFFRDALNLLDFVAILPWFLEKIFQPDTSPTSLNLEFEIIKLLRVLRVFKIFRAFSGTRILVETAQKSLKPLSLTLMMLFMFMTVVASIIFMIEPCSNADCVFKDSFNTGYFLAITLTTVGYGDQVPTHPFARFFAVITMLFGAIFLSMPIAVIGNKFELAYNAYEEREAHKNPEAAIEIAKAEYQTKIDQRRKRTVHGLFSILYDIQCVETILRKAKDLIASGATFVEQSEIDVNEDERNSPNDTSTQSKYAVKDVVKLASRRHAKGPASASLMNLSRKHHFVSVDIKQLFRSDKIDTSLPKHIQNLMHKITNDGIHITEEGEDTEEEKASTEGDVDVRSTIITHENSAGVQAFDIVRKNDTELHILQANVRKARQRNGCRDKVWLVLEAHASSRLAYYIYITRWLILLVSVALMMLSTFPEMHAYGDSSPYCRRLFATYCRKIDTTTSKKKSAWIQANPACFAWTREELQEKMNISATSDYSGCLDEATCAFPSVAHNMTCSFPVIFGNPDPQGSEEVAPCDQHPDSCAERLDPQNSIYSLMRDNTPVCSRTPCVDNVNVPSWTGGKSSGDYASLWAPFELILLAYFIVEYVIRVIVARDVKKFCKSNFLLFLFTIVLLVEFVIVISHRSGFRYDPWGFGPLDSLWDTHRLRPLRVIVPLRFCAFSSDFRGIKVAALTVERVAGRMMTPSLFFIVFMVLFGGIMYVFELLQCKAMEIPDGSGNMKWYYMNKNEQDDCTVQDMFDAIWIIIVT